MSVKNFKIPLKGYDASLSFSEIVHQNYNYDDRGDTFTTYEIA